jgi:phage terminase large subunit
MSITDIEEAKKSMSKAEFQQEYEANFNMYEGQVWNFNFEECVANLEELDTSKMDVIGGLDVGYRDPTAFCVIAYDWDTEKFYFLEEYYKAEATTEQHAKAINALIEKYDIDYIYIDSAAQQMRFDLAQDYDISTINATKDVNAGIAHVGTIIDNNNLIVDSKCAQALKSVDQYQWDPNPNLIKEKPVHNDASHMADAIRYALYSFQTVMTGF